METNDVSVFNLADSGANPYTEMLQIPALIETNPELVIIDLGPNSLWEFLNLNLSMNISNLGLQSTVLQWKTTILESGRN